MSSSFKLCPAHFSRGRKIFKRRLRPPSCGAACNTFVYTQCLTTSNFVFEANINDLPITTPSRLKIIFSLLVPFFHIALNNRLQSSSVVLTPDSPFRTTEMRTAGLNGFSWRVWCCAKKEIMTHFLSFTERKVQNF